MWDKCGTKIRNEINRVKKSTVFFGSGIYPKKNSFRQFCAAIGSVSNQVLCGKQLSAAKAVLSACSAK